MKVCPVCKREYSDETKFCEKDGSILEIKGGIHFRIKVLIQELSKGLIEKDEAVRLALLTAIAGESIFFLGAPGCAKSMIARRIVQAFKPDGDNAIKYFETLLNQFTTPEEVFGNISLKALNGELEGQNGKEEYRRLTENMLPEADVAFLDEIWKASPAILNTLLTIINEHKFHNGSKVMNVPLKALFAASNELPPKDKGLEALYDRFVLRLCVGYIQNESSFFDMIDGASSFEFALSEAVKALQITNDDLKEWKKQIDEIELSAEAKSVISAIRKELTVRNAAMSEDDRKNGELFEVGDRRWKKIAHILKASAFLNDRKTVDLMDCQLIEYCIWSTEKQQMLVRDIVETCIKQNGIDSDNSIEDITEQIADFKKTVLGQWFEEKQEEPKLYKMKDGTSAYKIITPINVNSYNNITAYYLNKDYKHSGYNRYGAYYDKDGNKIGDYDYYIRNNSVKLNNGNVSWTDGCRGGNYTTRIEMLPKKLVPRNLSGIARATLQKKFDSEYYVPVAESIQKRIKELKSQKSVYETSFTANLFANQEYNSIITSKIDDSIHEVEDAMISLDKERNRYFNKDTQDLKVAVGDIIFKDGTIYTSAEIGKESNMKLSDVMGVIAVTEEKIYVIGIRQCKGLWSDITAISSSYGRENNFSGNFASDWIVPDRVLLNKIWENRIVINNSLKKLGNNIEILSDGEYWSATPNGDSAAFYQMFDKIGKQDDTTKSHEYSMCLLHECNNLKADLSRKNEKIEAFGDLEDFALIEDGNKAPFYMSKYEVTQELYQSVTGTNPSSFNGNKRPVENVSWYDAIRFCNMFSKKEGKTPVYSVNGNTDVDSWNYTAHIGQSINGEVKMDVKANGYRLPTAKEWKFAAAGGKKYTYAGSNSIDEVAWYKGNSGGETHEVGQKNANGYGLYDMSGNVWEWCWDSDFNGNRYGCGGSWINDDDYCKVDDEDYGSPNYGYNYLGFRVACNK